MVEPTFLLAIDIGGTFTDLVLYNQGNGQIYINKVLTTYPDASIAVLSGVRELLTDKDIPPAQIDRVIHGTTLVTNALIERRGAKTALLTTKGFRDALEIGNEGRYDIYDLGLIKPTPLVERRLRFEVDQRIYANGQEAIPISVSEIEQLAERLQAEDIEAIGVCYLHAYNNPQPELQTKAVLDKILPDIPISLSHQVAPAIREHPRTSTTVANAYVSPLTKQYLKQLADGLQALEIDGPLNIMLSNAGTCTVDTAIDFPIRLVESGPCGGALASAFWAKNMGHPNVLAFDMGGTTAKAILSENGEYAVATQSEVAHVQRFKKGSGLPLLVPMIQMIEIGAGGGSVAGVNDLGLPRVGPESAGSSPGPACYELGGTAPTVTDADLLLGLISPHSFAGGRMKLSVEAAAAAHRKLGTELGMELLDLAFGIHELVNENMAAAARVHAAERGLDIRRYAMVATGGAGPVHACGVAEKLGINTLIVPPLAGVGSAFGFLLAPIAFDFTRTFISLLEDLDITHLERLLTNLEEEGKKIVSEAGVPPDRMEIRRTVDVRYHGQGYEIRVDLPPGPFTADFTHLIKKGFEEEYASFYGRLTDGIPIETVNWRVFVSGPPPMIKPMTPFAHGESKDNSAPVHRTVFFKARQQGWATPVFKRQILKAGFSMDGPVIIEEDESTTVVRPSWKVSVDLNGALVLLKQAKTKSND